MGVEAMVPVPQGSPTGAVNEVEGLFVGAGEVPRQMVDHQEFLVGVCDGA